MPGASERTPLIQSEQDKQYDQAVKTPPPQPPPAMAEQKGSTQAYIADQSEPIVEVEDPWTVQSHSSINSEARAFTHHATTNIESMMHVLKGNIGTGILAMPTAVMNAGLWFGFGGLFVIGIVATHCMHLLVICSHQLSNRTGMVALDYADVTETAFKLGPQSLRCMAKFMRMLVVGSLLLTQMGFCTVYILFVADNVNQVIEAKTSLQLDDRVYACILLVFLIPYVFVKNLKTLAYFSMAANVLTVVGLVIIFQNCLQNLPDSTERPAFASIETLPLYFGQAIYAFEGISLILPIENKMRHPEDFGGWTGVLTTSMTIVTVLYVSVGFFGYLKYGAAVTLGSITLNLPTDQWIYLIVKLIFAFTIFVTYGLQFYVPVKLIWPWLSRKIRSDKWRRYSNYILRVALVLISFAIAVAIPKLNLMISLIGAFSSSCLALIFPPMLEIVTFWPDGLGRYKWKLIKDILICIFGILGFLTGTYASVKQIIESFKAS